MARGVIRALALALLVGLLVPEATERPAGATAAQPDLASLVRPLAGTQRGGVFPGATTPFGMVQYSPNTDSAGGGGYRYAHPRTWGFATNHLSGPGCPAMGDVVSLPTTGPVRTVDLLRQKSTFSHASEQASPGYYAVDLSASRVHAELTAAPRSGWARFSYPAGVQHNVVVEPGANFRGTRAASVRVVGDDTVEGWVESWGYWHACPARGPNRYTLHFSMKFDRPFSGFGVGNGARVRSGARAANGSDAAAYVSFDAPAVVSKVGVSYVDVAGARRNLAADDGGGGFDFDSVRDRARSGWNTLLGRVRVSGGAERQLETFYTALYHALLYPSLFSDADDRYPGFDDRVHSTAAGQAHYANFSMWDTYRSAQQVVDLAAPERVPDMVRSLLDDQRQSGWMPKWPYAHFETNEMVGDPADNVIADALGKGLVRGEDVAPVYAALVRNASDLPVHSPFEARTGLTDYINRGFVPFHTGDDHTNSGSINMEYALNDCALALMAQRLGHRLDARYLLRRAKRYRYSIDRSTGFAGIRHSDGSFAGPVSERTGRGFKEGSAAQYTWLAPQDVAGLAGVLGGRAAALQRLDRFFAYTQLPADVTRSRFVWHGPSRYNPHNESDLQAPYLYNYLGQPWKTQDLVRAAEALFSTSPQGLPGSDDLGTMSGWYVLSALGLFPVTGGDDHYALTSPLFDHAELTLPGGRLVIDAAGASSGFRYVHAAALNGAPLATSALAHGSIARGGHLSFVLGSAPDTNWATGENTPSSACAANPSTGDLRLSVRQGRAFRRRTILVVRLHNAGDAGTGLISVHVRKPRGWSARLRSGLVKALPPGATRTEKWLVRAPGGRGSAALRVYAGWSRSGALRTFAATRIRVARR